MSDACVHVFAARRLLTFSLSDACFGILSSTLIAAGKSIDSPAVSALKEHYLGMDVYFNETRGGVCLREGNTYYTPEELLSMIMTHAQEMVKAHGGTHIRDCVITVPAFFTQHERRAVYDAAAIADMNVLSMIDDNTAAALQFAIDRTVEEPQTILYYNLGSSSAQVTIVEHSSYRVVEGGQNKSIGTLEVKGKSWDTTQGGYEFDLRLTELLADRFNAQHAKHSLNVRENVRAMTKLRTHARKIKEVLSANQKIPATAESLHQDYDLRTEVSRTDFENAAADLFDRLLVPIDRALRDANMTKDQISLVEVIGGSVRIPKVQAILREYFGDKELGMHLNGDESMALGTAFRAANLSTAFRVRRIGMQEVTSFPIKVELEGIDQPSGFLSRMANMFSKSDNAGEGAVVTLGNVIALFFSGRLTISLLCELCRARMVQVVDAVPCAHQAAHRQGRQEEDHQHQPRQGHSVQARVRADGGLAGGHAPRLRRVQHYRHR